MEKVSDVMVGTRSQNSSESQKAMLEIEIHPEPTVDEDRAGCGTEGSGNRRLAKEPTPVEKGPDFTTSTATLDREEMSELSDISTENVATTRSLTDNTKMHGGTEKTATNEEHFGKLCPIFYGNGCRR